MNRNMHPVIANSIDTRYNDDVVPPKSKRRKLNEDAYDVHNTVETFISPIKATQTNTINEHVHKMHKGRSTAILGQPFYEGLPHLSSAYTRIMSSCGGYYWIAVPMEICSLPVREVLTDRRHQCHTL